MASHDEPGTQVTIVILLVALEAVQLWGRGRNKQLEEEGAVAAPEPLAELGQAFGLAAVQIWVTFGIESDENLHEGRVESLDVFGEMGAILKVELVLTGALNRHGQRDACRQGAPGHCRAELLVYEYPRSITGRARSRSQAGWPRR